MVTFAVTLSDLIEKGGAYAGLAAFFGLAVLAVLYFAQARELKRLREWAGRAPERAQELEQAVVARATQARQPAPAAQPRQNPIAKPATAAASAAPPTAVASTPEETAETPATTATPPTEEGTPAEHEVVVKKVEADTEADDDAAAAREEEAAEETVTAGAAGASAQATATTSAAPPATTAPPQTGTTNGSGEIPVLPPRATPSPPPRRSAPAPAPYRPDRPLPPRSPLTSQLGEEPPRRNGAVIAGAGAGIILLVVAIIAILGGGGNDGGGKSTSTQSQGVTQANTAAPTTSATKRPTRPATTGPSRPNTKVEVLNGTTITGLAGSVNDKITQAGWGSAGTPTNYYEQTRSATIVFYATSVYRAQAQAIAKVLGVDDVQLVDANTRQLAPSANVIVVVGADQNG